MSSLLQSARDYFINGGFFMIPLTLASIIGVTAIFYKILSLNLKRILPAALAKALRGAAQTDLSVAQQKELERGESTLARLAHVAWQARGESAATREQAITSAARMELLRLHNGMSLLDNIVTVAPLLGLLGTASGLVEIFKGLGEAANHLAISKGIAEALHTTIFGLAIAVPCVIAHSFFSRKLEEITANLESTLENFSTALEKSNKR